MENLLIFLSLNRRYFILSSQKMPQPSKTLSGALLSVTSLLAASTKIQKREQMPESFFNMISFARLRNTEKSSNSSYNSGRRKIAFRSNFSESKYMVR
jgi:hypothetical protein